MTTSKSSDNCTDFERDPSVDAAAACPNPLPYTMIKCVYWGGPVTLDNAKNYGQYRDSFQVVIAGSNGYTNNEIITPPGYTSPMFLDKSAINAPLDSYGFDSYMGVAMFNSGPFDIKLCADACSMKSQYALAHPPIDGTPVTTCQVGICSYSSSRVACSRVCSSSIPTFSTLINPPMPKANTAPCTAKAGHPSTLR